MPQWTRNIGGIQVQIIGDLDYGMEFVQRGQQFYASWKNINKDVPVWAKTQVLPMSPEDPPVVIRVQNYSGLGKVMIFAEKPGGAKTTVQIPTAPLVDMRVSQHPYFVVYDEGGTVLGFLICENDFDLDKPKSFTSTFASQKDGKTLLVKAGELSGTAYTDIRPSGHQNLFTADFTATVEQGPDNGATYIRAGQDGLRLGPEYDYDYVMVPPTGIGDEGPNQYWYGTSIAEYFLTGPEGEVEKNDDWKAEILCWEPDHKILATPFYDINSQQNVFFSWDYGYRHLTGKSLLSGLYHNSWYDAEHYGMVYTVSTWDDYIDQPGSHGWELFDWLGGAHWNGSREYFGLERIDRRTIKNHRAVNVGDVIIRVNGEDYVLYEGVRTGYAIWPWIDMKFIWSVADYYDEPYTYADAEYLSKPPGWFHMPPGAEWPPYEHLMQHMDRDAPHYLPLTYTEPPAAVPGSGSETTDATPVPLTEEEETERYEHPRLGGWIQPHDGAHDGANIEFVAKNSVSYHATPFRGLGNLYRSEALNVAQEEKGMEPWYCSADDNPLGLSGEPYVTGPEFPGATDSGNFKYFYIDEEKQIFIFSFLIFNVPTEECVYQGTTYIDEPEKAEELKLVYGIVKTGPGWPEEVQGLRTWEYPIEPFDRWENARKEVPVEIEVDGENKQGYVSFDIGIAKRISCIITQDDGISDLEQGDI